MAAEVNSHQGTGLWTSWCRKPHSWYTGLSGAGTRAVNRSRPHPDYQTTLMATRGSGDIGVMGWKLLPLQWTDCVVKMKLKLKSECDYDEYCVLYFLERKCISILSMSWTSEVDWYLSFQIKSVKKHYTNKMTIGNKDRTGSNRRWAAGLKDANANEDNNNHCSDKWWNYSWVYESTSRIISWAFLCFV